jgi:hypothetical protein
VITLIDIAGAYSVFSEGFTMTDLNTAIAKYLGWKCYEMPRSSYRLQYVYAPGKFPWDNHYEKERVKAACIEIDLTQIDPGKFDGQKLPDYEHDARLYMALAVEMMEKYEVRLGVDENKQKYCELYDYEMVDEPVFILAEQADTIGTAICQAYVKLKGIEVVG